MKLLRRLLTTSSVRRPQAAVSNVVKVKGADKWLLVKRSKSPAKGKWSFPGGRIEWGETTSRAAARELSEEVPGLKNLGLSLEETSFCSSDAISPDLEHHYVITQFFGSVSTDPDDAEVEVASDAAEAWFFTAEEVAKLEKTGEAVGSLSVVIDKAAASFPDR